MGWFKALILGGQYRTLGAVQAEPRGGVKQELHVHLLEPKGIGQPSLLALEVVSSSFLSYQVLPIKLTTQEAAALITLLEQAVRAAA
jgi:hypothetical protein